MESIGSESRLLQSLDDLERAVETAAVFIQELFSVPIEQQLATLSPLDRAKLEVNVCFALNTLLFLYIKTQGANPMDYPVMKELARVKEYIIKVRKAENTYKSNMSVDKEAAERFIRHALSDQKKKNIGDDEEMSTAEADAVQGTKQTVSETKKSAEKDTSADGETVTTVSTPTPSSTSVNKKKKAKSK